MRLRSSWEITILLRPKYIVGVRFRGMDFDKWLIWRENEFANVVIEKSPYSVVGLGETAGQRKRLIIGLLRGLRALRSARGAPPNSIGIDPRRLRKVLPAAFLVAHRRVRPPGVTMDLRFRRNRLHRQSRRLLQ